MTMSNEAEPGTIPPSGAPLKAVVTMPDGAQWEAKQFTKL